MKLFGPGGLFAKLKERRFAQFLGVYAAAAWGSLQVMDQLTNRNVLPAILYPVALTFAICGFPAVLIVTWFHGQKGDQKMPRAEKVAIGVVALFAVTASGFVVRAGLAPAEADASALALEDWENPTRVAVLYFDHSPASDSDAEIIATGLTEGLIDQLSSVTPLHVISRNGSETVRGGELGDGDIARTLGVGTLVHGKVTVAGDQVRVSITMVKGGDGEQFADETVQAPKTDLFTLQDSLSAQVAIFLRGRIGEQLGQVEQRGGTDNVEAWKLVQEAEQKANGAQRLVASGDPNALHAAVDQIMAADALLERAEGLDPAWTLPITRRGWYAYREARFYGLQPVPQQAPTERGLAHAERALAINSNDADALELRGTLNYWRALINLVDEGVRHSVVDKAETDLEAATLANSRAAGAFATLSHLKLGNGDIPSANLNASRSYEADPFLANANLTLWRLASTSWELGNALESKKWCDEGRERFERDFRFQQCALMMYALQDYPSELDSAWARMNEFVELAPPPVRALTERQGQMLMAMALVRAQLPDSAASVALRARAGPDVDPAREVAWMETMLRTWLGRLYEGRGQADLATREFEEAAGQLSLFLTANPGALEGLQKDARAGRIDKWYFEGLATRPEFKRVVGVR